MKISVLFVIVILIVLVVLIASIYTGYQPVKIEKFNKRQYKAEKVSKTYIVDQSDVQYYKDIEDEYNHRLQFYAPEAEKSPTVEAETEPELNEHYFDNYVIRDYLNRERIEDSQNVHDTVIQNNVKNKYSKLPQDYSDADGTILEIMNFCNNDREIFDVIQKIKKRNARLVNFSGDTETDILKKTWNNGNLSVKNQIINELRDCKNNNSIYCPSGVATRIVSSTYIDNPENYPRDKDTINREILEKCAHLRKKNPEITQEELKQAIIEEYSNVHDSEFISGLMEPWLGYV